MLRPAVEVRERYSGMGLAGSGGPWGRVATRFCRKIPVAFATIQTAHPETPFIFSTLPVLVVGRDQA
jgi:hypothetical protein